jgi:hypothetical protein
VHVFLSVIIIIIVLFTNMCITTALCFQCSLDIAQYVQYCQEPAASQNSHHVSLVQCTTCLLPIMSDLSSNPQGGTEVKPGFSCYFCPATLGTPT